jgi:hypothetical protein
LDAFIFASKTETTSLASLEAYARNLKIFSTPVGFLAKNPTVFKNIHIYENPEKLADLIYEILILKKDYSETQDESFLNSKIINYNKFIEEVTREFIPKQI